MFTANLSCRWNVCPWSMWGRRGGTRRGNYSLCWVSSNRQTLSILTNLQLMYSDVIWLFGTNKHYIFLLNPSVTVNNRNYTFEPLSSLTWHIKQVLVFSLIWYTEGSFTKATLTSRNMYVFKLGNKWQTWNTLSGHCFVLSIYNNILSYICEEISVNLCCPCKEWGSDTLVKRGWSNWSRQLDCR